MDQPNTPLRSELRRMMLLIEDDILRLGALIELAMAKAIQAFAAADVAQAQSVINDDDLIDSLHVRLEDTIEKTFALQQPVTSDLRWLISALLITNELERMGDYAETISRQVIRRADEPGLVEAEVVQQMREVVTTMIHGMMQAFAEKDPDKAREVAALNDKLDAIYKSLFSRIVGEMGEDKLSISQGTYLLWVAQYLERIGSRVINIEQRVIYSKTGDPIALRSRRRARREA